MTKRVFLIVLILFLFSNHLFGERLPFKIFTTENGLPQNLINRIVRDSNGFLWFCTEDGLSRFDGNLFVNFDTSNGLPHPQVNYILEASDKVFWLATNGAGVVRFDPSPKLIDFDKNSVPSFTVFPVLDSNNVDANRVNFLYEDKNKRIWVGTSSGLFWLEVESKTFHRVAVLPNDENVSIRGFTENSNGDLWMWSMNGVFRRKPDGNITHFSLSPNGNYDPTRKILFDKNGKIWIAHEQIGLLVLDENKLAEIEQKNSKNSFTIDELKPAILNWFNKDSGLKNDKVFAIFQSANGHIWIGTSMGLSEYDGKAFRNYSKNEGFPETISNWITEDIDGNIWATTNQGAVKFASSGFRTYQQNENLGVRGVRSLWETSDGNLQALTPVGLFHQLEGDKFVSLKPKLPKDTNFEFPQNTILDSQGNIWCPTKDGLFRFRNFKTFSGLENTLPEKLKNLPDNFVNRIFEDSKGDIWIGLANRKQSLFRWNRKTGNLTDFNDTKLLPDSFSILSFSEDSYGNIWIGSIGGEIVRYKNDTFKVFSASDGVPLGQIQDLFADSQKQLWVATRGGGIGKITDTNAEIPSFSIITTKDGILSNNVTTIIEDNFGRIYFGTGRGIDWLEPNSGQTGRFTTVDGLNDNKIELSFRDKKGVLWFGTANSLAKFVPQPISKDSSHSVFISNLSVNGKKLAISEYGQLEVNKFELDKSENQIQIEFSGLDFSTGQNLQFQHKLIGAENVWSLPSQDRKVNFANLAPGDYEFVVKPAGSEEFPIISYATVKFKILSPIYLRWWFLALSVSFIGLIIHQLYRFRILRLLEIERTRTRIATDLHDDIGSDLSKISILSEVVKMQMKSGNEDSNRLLTTIAETSRKSVDSMRDIVWAINPSRDSLDDLVKKMRQFAEESLVEKNIKLIFNAPNNHQNLKLSMDTRREVWLIFKESLTNSAKHANCSQIAIDFEITGKEIRLNIKDNGKGFDTSKDFDGNGLNNMKRRCENLKGRFELTSSQENGTNISAKFPQV